MANARQFMAARTAAWSKSGAPLLYDAEVEWIQTTLNGSAKIDTGIVCVNEPSVRILFDYSGYAATSDFDICGTSEVEPAFRLDLQCWTNYGGDPRKSRFWNRYFLATTVSTQEFIQPQGMAEIVFGPTGSLVNGFALNEFDRRGRDWSKNTHSMILFGSGRNNNTNNVTKMQRAEILDGDIVVFDAKSVRITNENGVSEGAMYDRVSGQLFRNAGTGAFIIGPDKT